MTLLDAFTHCADNGQAGTKGQCLDLVKMCSLGDLRVVSNGKMALSSDDHEAIAGAKAVAKCDPGFSSYDAPAICKTGGTWTSTTPMQCKPCPTGCATCTEKECLSCTDRQKQVNGGKTGCIIGARTCTELGVKKSGWNSLTPDAGPMKGTQVRAYCHVVTNNGKTETHTSIPCGALSKDGVCIKTNKYKADNTCKVAGAMYGHYPARNPKHFKSLFDTFGMLYLKAAPVVLDDGGWQKDATRFCGCILSSNDWGNTGDVPSTNAMCLFFYSVGFSYQALSCIQTPTTVRMGWKERKRRERARACGGSRWSDDGEDAWVRRVRSKASRQQHAG